MTSYSLAIYRDEEREISLDELARAVGVHTELVERFVDCGLLEHCATPGRSAFFDTTAVARLGAICRLRRDLGVNVASVAVILDLVDRVAELEREVVRLRNAQ